MHSREFQSRGGAFEVVQLWVNLPKQWKMSPAGYQTLLATDIPVVELATGAGSATSVMMRSLRQRTVLLAKGDSMRKSSFYVLLLALLIHSLGLATRMYLQGRPPVTNVLPSGL